MMKSKYRIKSLTQLLVGIGLFIALFQSPHQVKASIVDDLWGVVEGAADGIGGLLSKALGVNASLGELEETIGVASDEVQETILVASGEGQQVMRVAKTEFNQVVDNVSDEGHDFSVRHHLYL